MVSTGKLKARLHSFDVFCEGFGIMAYIDVAWATNIFTKYRYDDIGYHNTSFIANLIAIAVATIWNFWVNLKLSWLVTPVK